MIKKIFFISLFNILFIGCDSSHKDYSQVEIVKDSLNLKNDIFNLTSKMQENDTVYLLANVSACMVWQMEMNHIFKKNDTIYVETFLNGDFIDSSNSYLAKVPYEYETSDTLNFENLFTYLDIKNIKYEKINSNVITVIHNLDTVKYYSKGLGDHLYNIEYYNAIKRKIYPNASIYQPIELIEPPIPDSAHNNLNLIK